VPQTPQQRPRAATTEAAWKILFEDFTRPLQPDGRPYPPSREGAAPFWRHPGEPFPVAPWRRGEGPPEKKKLPIDRLLGDFLKKGVPIGTGMKKLDATNAALIRSASGDVLQDTAATRKLTRRFIELNPIFRGGCTVCPFSYVRQAIFEAVKYAERDHGQQEDQEDRAEAARQYAQLARSTATKLANATKGIDKFLAASRNIERFGAALPLIAWGATSMDYVNAFGASRRHEKRCSQLSSTRAKIAGPAKKGIAALSAIAAMVDAERDRSFSSFDKTAWRAAFAESLFDPWYVLTGLGPSYSTTSSFVTFLNYSFWSIGGTPAGADEWTSSIKAAMKRVDLEAIAAISRRS
jgi:hypothetical protein